MYELWSRSGNLAGRYRSEKIALLAVLEHAAAYGDDAVDGLTLTHEEEHGTHKVACGMLLLTRVRAASNQ